MKIAAVLALSLALLGCGGGNDAPVPVVLYINAGSVQCAASLMTQSRLDAATSALRSAGASVLASSCANDGMAHVALCGADNGDMFSVTVSPSSAAIAQQVGFKLAAEFPNARPAACVAG